MSVNATPAILAKLRLASLGIIPSTSTSPTPGPVDVVRSLTALQGQDLPGALWSIGLRSPGSTRTDIEAAFNSGELVRSWPMRGTLHVCAAEDLGWILSLTGERMVTAMAGRHRQLGITTADLQLVRELALGLLEHSGGRASRQELFAAFEQAGQRTSAQRGIHLLWRLCTQGTLVQGPVGSTSGKGPTQFFVSSKMWIKKPRNLERDQALAELALRYFRSHGPATIKDFQWWTKLTRKDINIGMAQIANQLTTLECNGTTYWLALETAELARGPLPGNRSMLLLPGFDEYLLGYTDRSAALAPHHAPLTVPGNNGMFKATIVAGGQVVGTWRKAQGADKKDRQVAGVVLPEFFAVSSPAQQKALAKSAANYSAFIGGSGA